MTILNFNDTTTIPGLALPTISGINWAKCENPICVDALCPKRVSDHNAWVATDFTGNNGVYFEAQVDSYNTTVEAFRLTHGIMKLMSMITGGVPNYSDTVDEEENHNLGNELPNGASYIKVWKEFTWTIDPSFATTASYIDVLYSSEAYDSDPRHLRDNESEFFTMSGWGECSFGNSKQAHMARVSCYAYDRDTPSVGKMRIHVYPDLIGDRLLTPADAHEGTEEDPHDPVTLTARFFVGDGRESWTMPRDLTPFYAVQKTYTQSIDGTWPPPVVETAMYSNVAMAPNVYPLNTSTYLLVEKKVGGVWSEWSGAYQQVYNILNGSDVYEGVIAWHLLDLTDIQDVRVTAWFEDSTTAKMHVCSDRCTYSEPDYAYSCGEIDPTTAALNAKWFCLMAQDSNVDISQYSTTKGRCRNENCQFFTLPGIANLSSFVPEIIDARPFYKEETHLYIDLGWLTVYTLYRRNFKGLRHLADDPMTLVGDVWSARDWECASPGGFGKLDDTQATVAVQNGFEVIGTDEAGPGASPAIASQTIHYANDPVGSSAIAGVANDPLKHYTFSLTSGPSGVSRMHNSESSKPCRRTDYVLTELVFPQINPLDADWQRYEDGKVKLGFWTADLTEQEAADGDTVYYMQVQITNPILPVKNTISDFEMESITTVTGKAATSLGGGLYVVTLKHRATTVAKAGGTGEEDVPLTAYISGTNVLPQHSMRVLNWACPEAIQGAGSRGYVTAGMALKVTVGDFVYLLPVVWAKDCVSGESWSVADEHFGTDDASVTNKQNISDAASNGGGLPRYASDGYKWLDAARVYDEAGILATITVEDTQFEVVEGAWAIADAHTAANHVYLTGVSTANSEDTGALKHWNSGRIFTTSVPECLYLKVMLARFRPVLSAARDVNVISDVIEKMFGE